MENNLKKMYETFTPYTINTKHPFKQYIWFEDGHELFGIHQSELTEREIKLLSMLYRRIDDQAIHMTPNERLWRERFAHNIEEASPHPYRFIYFTFTYEQMDKQNFTSAVKQLFDIDIPIFWINETAGMMIEEKQSEAEWMNWDDIIPVLMSDLSISLKMYISQMFNDFKQVLQMYEHTVAIGQKVLKHTIKQVTKDVQVIPYLMTAQLDALATTMMQTTILPHLEDDKEMVQTLETFFESNMNVTETAKKLYLHRNSLQYRLDKFQKQSHISLQNFDEAIAVKLALTFLRHIP